MGSEMCIRDSHIFARLLLAEPKHLPRNPYGLPVSACFSQYCFQILSSQDSQNNNRIYYARKQAAHDHPCRIRQTVLIGRAGKAITCRYGRTGIYQKIPMQSLGVHEAGIAANASIFPRSFIKIFKNLTSAFFNIVLQILSIYCGSFMKIFIGV